MGGEKRRGLNSSVKSWPDKEPAKGHHNWSKTGPQCTKVDKGRTADPTAGFTEGATGVTQQGNAARVREYIRLSVTKMEQKNTVIHKQVFNICYFPQIVFTGKGIRQEHP